jgi:K+-transporting ATPase ATPase A chain
MYPLGIYMAQVFSGEVRFLSRFENLIYRVCGIHSDEEMSWHKYAGAMLLFSFVSLLITYLIERIQYHLPWNPQHLPGVEQFLAWNTAASFTTNTNWQAYTNDVTMSYFTQMAGLAYHNFLSAAVGISVAIALVRGIARRESKTIGNFWVDATRSCLYVLLPLSVVFALLLVGQGVPQNLRPYTAAQTLEHLTQTIAQGPVASQEVIKELGTNGGGFFSANSAHPFENPTPFSNFIEMFLIFLIGAGLTVSLGRMTGAPGHGWAVFACMSILFAAGFVVAYWAESQPNPALHGIDQRATALQAGGNMEGKETRFGVSQSALYDVASTQTSTGSVDGSNDSYTPIGGMALLTGMMLGEVTPGGTGSGLYTILIYALIAVFLGGLMVGRTPEYLGKKIQAREVKLAALGSLVMPMIVLILTAIAVSIHAGRAGPLNAGPHGFTEILYALTSQANNNGSAFAGLTGNTAFYNVVGGIDMLVGRFAIMIPALALAGALAAKQRVPASSGTFRTDTPLFTGLVVGVIIIIGALTFFPAVALGPIVEQLIHGRFF